MGWMLWALAGCSPDLASIDPDAIPEEPSYEQHIAPLLSEHCVRCHQRDGTLDGGVELDSYIGARGTRVSTVCTSVSPAVIDVYAEFLVSRAGTSGQRACSEWHALSMPPGAEVKLTLTEQVLLAEWVAQGAQP